MVYEYRCPACKYPRQILISKPVKDAAKVEYCSRCHTELIRVYSTGIKTTDGVKR